MAIITAFPVDKMNKANSIVQSTSNTTMFYSAINDEMDINVASICPKCGGILHYEDTTCPKCKCMAQKNVKACTTYMLMSYMDTLRAALRDVDVKVSNGYDMALAA